MKVDRLLVKVLIITYGCTLGADGPIATRGLSRFGPPVVGRALYWIR